MSEFDWNWAPIVPINDTVEVWVGKQVIAELITTGVRHSASNYARLVSDQPKCPLKDQWVKVHVYKHDLEKSNSRNMAVANEFFLRKGAKVTQPLSLDTLKAIDKR